MLPTQIYDNVDFGYADNGYAKVERFFHYCVIYKISLFKKKEKNTKNYPKYRESLGIGQLRQRRLQYTHFLMQFL